MKISLSLLMLSLPLSVCAMEKSRSPNIGPKVEEAAKNLRVVYDHELKEESFREPFKEEKLSEKGLLSTNEHFLKNTHQTVDDFFMQEYQETYPSSQKRQNAKKAYESGQYNRLYEAYCSFGDPYSKQLEDINSDLKNKIQEAQIALASYLL